MSPQGQELLGPRPPLTTSQWPIGSRLQVVFPRCDWQQITLHPAITEHHRPFRDLRYCGRTYRAMLFLPAKSPFRLFHRSGPVLIPARH
jgi:hypothetical protein